MRNGFASAILLAAIALTSAPSRADTVLVDGIAAVVGDTPILLSALDARVRRLLPELQQKTQIALLPAAIEVAKKEVLKQLIDTQLILRAAAEKNVSVAERDVEAAFDSVAQQNKISRQELLVQIENAGLTLPQYRTEIIEQILRAKMLSIVVLPRIRITEEQIRATYDAAKAANPTGTPSFQEARAAITQKLQTDLLEKGQAAWVEELRRATYIEVRL